MKKRVFISYISSDKQKKNALKKLINNTKGFEAIVVEDYSKSNMNFIDKVKADIDRSDYFVPIFTKNSYKKSQWVNQELGYAEAKLGRDKIYIIVQNSIMQKLKGFYNDKMDLPYNFISENKEQINFRRAIKKLMDDVLEKERQDRIKHFGEFLSTSKRNYDPLDIPIDMSITDTLKIHFKIRKTSLDQVFSCYYKIETSNKEMLWVGFTDNKESIDKPYKAKNEFTKHIGKPNSLKYEFVENIKKTFHERWPEKGVPVLIKNIRFRGDKNIDSKILYYYKIEQ